MGRPLRRISAAATAAAAALFVVVAVAIIGVKVVILILAGFLAPSHGLGAIVAVRLLLWHHLKHAAATVQEVLPAQVADQVHQHAVGSGCGSLLRVAHRAGRNRQAAHFQHPRARQHLRRWQL